MALLKLFNFGYILTNKHILLYRAYVKYVNFSNCFQHIRRFFCFFVHILMHLSGNMILTHTQQASNKVSMKIWTKTIIPTSAFSREFALMWMLGLEETTRWKDISWIFLCFCCCFCDYKILSISYMELLCYNIAVLYIFSGKCYLHCMIAFLSCARARWWFSSLEAFEAHSACAVCI